MWNKLFNTFRISETSKGSLLANALIIALAFAVLLLKFDGGSVHEKHQQHDQERHKDWPETNSAVIAKNQKSSLASLLKLLFIVLIKIAILLIEYGQYILCYPWALELFGQN